MSERVSRTEVAPKTFSPVVGQMPPLARVAPITASPSVSTSMEQNWRLKGANFNIRLICPRLLNQLENRDPSTHAAPCCCFASSGSICNLSCSKPWNGKTIVEAKKLTALKFSKTISFLIFQVFEQFMPFDLKQRPYVITGVLAWHSCDQQFLAPRWIRHCWNQHSDSQLVSEMERELPYKMSYICRIT